MPVNNYHERKLRRKRMWRACYIAFACSISASGILFSYFIYQNIFAALANTYTAGLLQTTAYIDVIDSAAYDKALLNIKNKKPILIDLDSLKNPFFESNATSTPPSADR